MSKEVAIRFLTEVISHQDTLTQDISLNPEELRYKAEEQGIKVTSAELAAAAETILMSLAETEELSEEELELVSGGGDSRMFHTLSSVLKSMNEMRAGIIRNWR